MTQIYEKWYPTDVFSDQNLSSTSKRGRQDHIYQTPREYTTH